MASGVKDSIIEGLLRLRGKNGGWISLAKIVLGPKPTRNHLIQLIRSLVVSVIALSFDFSSLVFLKQVVGLHYLLAATLGFCIGVLVNYYLSVTWVFARRKLSSKRGEFAIFVIITGLGLLFNLLIIAAMVELVGFDYRIGKVVSTILVFFWNFGARKKLLY